MNRVVVFCVGAELLILGGCRASVSAESKNNRPEYERPIDEDPVDDDSGLSGGDVDPTGTEFSLVGARPDLGLAAESPAPSCECLAVSVGNANDPEFFWQGSPPRLAPGQLVIAVSSIGVPCPAAAADSLGASYWGHRREGENVVVVVEQARDGRPMTAGAIIPQPGPGGAVYVAPVSARIPYGRSLVKGEKYCRVYVSRASAAGE
ncbi:MAG: hypothetical protein JW751_15820 [Polyangiaceae bacterium]|nr:hypothetical protein [Polyangiaceae bacterium]